MINLAKLMQSRKTALITIGIIAFVILLLSTYGAYHYLQKTQSIARVDSAYIKNDVHLERIDMRQSFLAAQEQEIDENTVSRDVLDIMIDDILISRFARTNSITVTEDEVDARYEQIISMLEDGEIEERIQELYGENTSEYRKVLRADILRDKVQYELGDTPLREWLSERRSEARIDIYKD